jgi:hypothetical protein
MPHSKPTNRWYSRACQIEHKGDSTAILMADGEIFEKIASKFSTQSAKVRQSAIIFK